MNIRLLLNDQVIPDGFENVEEVTIMSNMIIVRANGKDFPYLRTDVREIVIPTDLPKDNINVHIVQV